jgi:RimJ/RimL family protein N-acetyltransferase
MNFWQDAHVKLRAVEPSDAEFFFEWNQDSDMTRHIDWLWPPSSLESARRMAEEEARRRPTDDTLFLVIENREGERVGMISTHQCDRRAGTFRYGVAIRREHQRSGYASAAILLVLRYFFEELRYQKVTVNIHANNPACIRLHERLGYQLEGQLRRIVFSGGQLWDELHMGMTVEEFQARYRHEGGDPGAANPV